MALLPSSPRKRRRVIRAGIALAVAGAIAAVVSALPTASTPNPAPTTNEGPAQLVAQTPSLHVAARDRRAIDATLDRFIPAAVGRRDMTTAWRLAGPELKDGSTLAGWRRGDTPVPAYPVRGTTFHSWETIDATRDEVDFNLLVHPRRGSHLGSYVFAGEMVKRGGRWLVNRLYTTAIMNPVRGSSHEVGPLDFTAAGSQAAARPTKARLGGIGLLPVLGIIGLVLLIPLALGIVALVRARRWRRRIRETGRRELPPLPFDRTPRGAEPEREPASRA
jgi:hypothetical protein